MSETKNPLRQMLSEQQQTIKNHKPSLPSLLPAKHEAWRSQVDGNVYWTLAGKCYTRGADGQKREISQGEYEKHAAGSGRTLGGKLGRKVKNADGTTSVVKNPLSPRLDNSVIPYLRKPVIADPEEIASNIDFSFDYSSPEDALDSEHPLVKQVVSCLANPNKNIDFDSIDGDRAFAEFLKAVDFDKSLAYDDGVQVTPSTNMRVVRPFGGKPARVVLTKYDDDDSTPSGREVVKVKSLNDMARAVTRLSFSAVRHKPKGDFFN